MGIRSLRPIFPCFITLLLSMRETCHSLVLADDGGTSPRNQSQLAPIFRGSGWGGDRVCVGGHRAWA